MALSISSLAEYHAAIQSKKIITNGDSFIIHYSGTERKFTVTSICKTKSFEVMVRNLVSSATSITTSSSSNYTNNNTTTSITTTSSSNTTILTTTLLLLLLLLVVVVIILTTTKMKTTITP